MRKQHNEQVGEGGGGGPRLGRSYQLPSPGTRVEEFANELSKVETIPVVHIFQRNIVIEDDTTTFILPGCRDRLQSRSRWCLAKESLEVLSSSRLLPPFLPLHPN